MIVLLCTAAMAGSVAGNGTHTTTLLMRGLSPGLLVQVERPGLGTITLEDPGLGVLQGTFRGPPARFAQLRMVSVGREGKRQIFEGMVMLADADHDTIAFEYDPRERGVRRIPVTPSARVDLQLDERVTWWVAFGWGALALAYVGTLTVVWARRRG